jgi:rubrerythrin
MKTEQLNELILQSLEHEMGGVKVYEAAIACASNDDLRKEWTKYLDQTKTHVQRLQKVCSAFGLDAEKETPGRQVVRHLGAGLVQAMKMALQAGEKDAAELVACECVVVAETKDHLDWELLAQCAPKLTGPQAAALKDASDQVEDEEDEHLYHTKGWCRELWLKSLGLKAVLPPPEERKNVKTAIGAARAEQAAHPHR